MWYVSVYATVGAIVILLMSRMKSFSERWQTGIRMAERGAEELWPFDEQVVDLILFVVVAVLLLTWPALPVSFARRHLKQRRGPKR